MKSKFVVRLAAAALACSLCLSLAACGSGESASASESSAAQVSEPETTEITATAAAAITLPEGFTVPTAINGFEKQTVGDVLYGAVNMTQYRNVGYIYSAGSCTFTYSGTLFDGYGEPVTTARTDVTVALWKQLEGAAEFVKTVHYVADGSAQQYTFDGLDTSSQYRFTITYTDNGAYYMTGQFSISGVAEMGTDEEPTVSA